MRAHIAGGPSPTCTTPPAIPMRCPLTRGTTRGGAGGARCYRASAWTPPHYRRAAPTAQRADGAENNNNVLERFGRVLPGYSLSSFVLLALFPRWCASGLRSQKDKGAHASKKFKTLFNLLLETYLSGEWGLEIIVDFDAQIIPGFGAHGTGPRVVLPVDVDGVVRTDLLSNGSAQGQRLYAACGGVDELQLADLAIAWCSQKKLAYGFIQLVGQVATRIEGVLMPPKQEKSVAKGASQPVQAGSHSQGLGAFGLNVAAQLKASRRARMIQYLLAGRKHFDRDLIAMSGVCDAGRFGHRECLLVACATPDGVVMWAPPVVPWHT